MVKAPAESPEFEASGSEFGDSDSGDAAAFSSSGSNVFSASDGEEQDLPKRRYARRRASFQQFLGRPVCARALARLLGIGQKTLQRLRDGQQVYRRKSAPTAPKHPEFGFSLRGHSSEKLLRLKLQDFFSAFLSLYMDLL